MSHYRVQYMIHQKFHITYFGQEVFLKNIYYFPESQHPLWHNHIFWSRWNGHFFKEKIPIMLSFNIREKKSKIYVKQRCYLPITVYNAEQKQIKSKAVNTLTLIMAKPNLHIVLRINWVTADNSYVKTWYVILCILHKQRDNIIFLAIVI